MFKNELLQRFLRYAVTDTMSNSAVAASVHPSTEGQWELLKMLEKELLSMGLEDVELDSKGYLLARIPATAPDLPCIAFSSHVDTADDVEGNHVHPRVINEYDGGDIVLNSERTIYAADNPELLRYTGTTLIVSDGNTLLGADDKAGIAEIMTAAGFLLAHPEIRHGEVEILFSPDEETGHGMDFFDVRRLHSQALYTVDGGTRYEIEAECFNAAESTVVFTGIPSHLGAARGKMVNAVTMCAAFISALPQSESPEATDGRYGYYCPHEVKGTALEAELKVILRDFEFSGLQHRMAALEALARSIEQLYPGGKASVRHEISYRNMAEAAKAKPKAMEAVFAAGKALGQPLEEKIIRGGTDGARIAEYGIPCPNIYTGGHNYHSYFEWAALEAMNDAAALIVEIVKQWAL